MIVVDNDVVVAFFTNVEITRASQRLRDADDVWIAPDVLRSEFVAVIRKYVRGRRLDADLARTTVADFEQMITFKPSLDRLSVFDEAMRLDMSPYDVEYLMLARSLDVKLVTGDGGFINRRLAGVVDIRTFLPALP